MTISQSGSALMWVVLTIENLKSAESIRCWTIQEFEFKLAPHQLLRSKSLRTRFRCI